MILKSESKKTGTNNSARDLSLIISEFSSTIAKYECESNIPITMWVELEENKNDLIRTINIINDENIDLEKYDPNNDIHSIIWAGNDSKPYRTETGDYISNTNISSNNCNFCNPIKVDFNLKLQKPSIKANLELSIDTGNLMFSSNAPIVCSTALVMSQGCIPDLVRIIGMLLMALNTIISSVNLESLSLSSFISATLGAVLDISIKKGMFMFSVSVSKSECLSAMIKEIISYLPTSQSMNERLDPELLKKFGLYNRNPTNYIKMFETLDKSLTLNGKDGIDKAFDGMSQVTSVIDDAIQHVNDWLEGLFGLSNYLPCERERSNSKPSTLIEQIMNLITMINTIRAIIDKKYQKEQCGSVETPADQTGDTLTPDDIVEIINNIIDIDKIIKDNDGNTIAIILPSVGLKTVYLDTFGCNLPHFMDFVTDMFNNPEYETSLPVTSNTNVIIGENEEQRNAYESNLFQSTDPIRNPSSSYNAKRPTVMKVEDIDENQKLSEDYINIADTLTIVSGLINRIREDNILSQELIVRSPIPENDSDSEQNKQISVYDSKPGEKSIEDIMRELDTLSMNSNVTMSTSGECKK